MAHELRKAGTGAVNFPMNAGLRRAAVPHQQDRRPGAGRRTCHRIFHPFTTAEYQTDTMSRQMTTIETFF
jgi:hypothetical protein